MFLFASDFRDCAHFVRVVLLAATVSKFALFTLSKLAVFESGDRVVASFASGFRRGS